MWFTLGLITDTNEHYHWTLQLYTIQNDLNLQGYRAAKMQKLQHQFSHEVLRECWSNLVCCWDMSVWWLTNSFDLIPFTIKQGNQLTWFDLHTNFYWTWYDDRLYKALQTGTHLNGHNHPRSRTYEKTKTSALIFSPISHWICYHNLLACWNSS